MNNIIGEDTSFDKDSNVLIIIKLSLVGWKALSNMGIKRKSSSTFNGNVASPLSNNTLNVQMIFVLFGLFGALIWSQCKVEWTKMDVIVSYFAMWLWFKWGKCILNIGVINLGTWFEVINLNNIYMMSVFLIIHGNFSIN